MTRAARPALLISSTDFAPATGGIQRTLHEIAHRLAERWAVTVVAPQDPGSVSYDAGAPFRVHRTRSSWHDGHLTTLVEMSRLTARFRPDMVLAGHLNALPSLLAPGRGRPRAVLIYGSEVWAPQTAVMTRLLGGSIDRAFAISRFTSIQAARAGIPDDRIVITPLGADPSESTPSDLHLLSNLGLVRGCGVAPFLLTISRLERHKGHDVVLRSLPVLLAHFPDLRYVIAGEGAEADKLAELAGRLGVRHAVLMTKAVDEKLKGALLANCRVFVMLSRESRRPALFEGFGLAFIEAAMAGRPSVAGRSGGVEDAVVNEETGLLVDPNSEAEFIAATTRLLGDPALADAFGAQGRKRALKGFTWEAAVGRIGDHMEAML